jgi:uncharacterized membrane protein YqaE (UPF0057 family)
MKEQFAKDAFLWGFLLWLLGYILGIVFFMFIPQSLLGWAIMPFGTAVTVWVLVKKVKGTTLQYYLKIAVVWTLIAIVFDYFFLVQLFKTSDYYKLDVYLYYFLTFLLPLVVGWRKGIIRK